MKKIIKKFWGIAFAIVLISTLFIGALPQASAGILAYTWATLPSDQVGGITAAGTVITDFVVAGDGSCMYVAAVGGGFKSTDGGRSWGRPMASLLLVSPRQVAVAPDKASLVAFLDPYTNNVSVSLNGGTTFTNLGVPSNLAGTLAANMTTDIAISKTNAGINYIAVTGADGTNGALYYYNLGGVATGWRNAVLDSPWVTGTHPQTYQGFLTTCFNAVEFSPAFDQDYIAYVVGYSSNLTANYASLHIASFNQYDWDNTVSGWSGYDEATGAQGGTRFGATDLTTGAITPTILTSNVTRSKIVFAPDFTGLVNENRLAYVSLACQVNNTGGVWRFTDNGIPGPIVNRVASTSLPASAMWSIALSPDATKLIAAAAEANFSWTITSPTSPSQASATASRAVKRVGANAASSNQTVAYNGANLYLAKAAAQGAFSLSTDNGYTFNDISLVNTTIAGIVDTVVKDDGVARYVIANNSGNYTSVFYFDGTYWQRTLTMSEANFGGGIIYSGTLPSFVAKASPTNFAVLYIGDPGNCNVFYTNSAGTVNWLTRFAPIPSSALVDLEVQSDTDLYVAANIANFGGLVYKLTVTGQIWTPSTIEAAAPSFGTGLNLASITLVSANNLLVGSIAGRVSYSTDGAASFRAVSGPTQIATGATSVFATATALSTGSVIYATAINTASVYAWTLGTSTTWGLAIFTGPFVTGGSNSLSTDLEIYNGCIYLIGTNGTDMTLSRSFLSTAARGGWLSTNISVQANAPYGPSFPSTANPNVVPDVLKFSNDAANNIKNQVWFIDSLGVSGNDQIIVYTDTLAVSTPIATTKCGILVQVNKQTGRAYNLTLNWAAASVATQYQLQIAYDKDFTRLYTTVNVNAAQPLGSATNWIIGPDAPAVGGTVVFYQPGETYYWRVRANLPYFSNWASVCSLTVQPAQAPVPDLLSPANGGTVKVLDPGFSWTVMSGATKYRFQIASDAAFTHIIQSTDVDASAVDGAGVQLTAPLVDGNQYFWHVQVLEPVVGDWSTVGNFIVDLTAASPPVTLTTAPAPIINLTQAANEVVNPSYIWAIIIIGAVLVIAVIVLIVRTRKVS